MSTTAWRAATGWSGTARRTGASGSPTTERRFSTGSPGQRAARYSQYSSCHRYITVLYSWLTQHREKILHWLTGTEGSPVQPVQFLPQVWDCTVLYIWLTDHREKILHWLTGTEASPVQPVQLLPQVYDSLYCTQVAHPPQGEDPPLAHGDREQPGTASTVNFFKFSPQFGVEQEVNWQKESLC